MDGKIYNFLNFAGLITAVVAAWPEGKCCEAILWGLGMMIIFLPFNFAGGIGGGDVKCFGVIAAFTGLNRAVELVLVAMIIGTVSAILRRQRRIRLGVFMPAAHVIVELMLGGIG